MLNIAVIIGSTRPGRVGEGVAKWVYEVLRKRSDAKFELVDLKAFDLPLLDEPVTASMSNDYTKPHTQRWSRTVEAFDAFVFVTPEYNHGMPAALKNAIDFLYKEWNHKAAGFVSYGVASGIRSVEQLRLVMAEIKVSAVRSQVPLSLFRDFENFQILKPSAKHERSVHTLVDELITLGEVMKGIRETAKEKAA